MANNHDKEHLLTADRAQSLFAYDAETGIITRRRTRCTVKSKWKKYLRVRIGGKDYLVHRLIWLIVHGRWPANQIDHINCIPTDNRLANLRECNASENMRNRPGRQTHLKGIHKFRNRWVANIQINKKKKNLGSFVTPEEAHAAYAAAALAVHGEFARLA